MAHTKQDTAVRRNSKLLDVSYIIPMEAQEARQQVESIRGHLTQACDKLVELHERQGWKALGYTSMVDCMRAEFDMSKSRGYQLLSYVKVKNNVQKNSTLVEKLPEISERQARPLTTLPTDEQVQVWQEAVETAPNHAPTAKQVTSIVERRYPITRPVPKPVSTTKRSHVEFDTRARCKGLLDRASERLVEEVYALLCERLSGAS